MGKKMNKEQQELLDEAYENYVKNYKPQHQLNLDVQPGFYDPMSKEWFIKAVMEKNSRGREFSERWGLRIEERELSLEERYQIAIPIWKEQYGPLADMMVPTNVDNTPFKIPTKLITITYNNKTIESYE
jgi:hypothetical protein